MIDFIVFFTVALSAENLFFIRGFDVYGLYELKRSPSKIVSLGGLSTVLLVMAGSIAYFLNRLIFGTVIYNYISGIVHLLILSAVYVAVYILLKRFYPKLFQSTGKYLPFAAFNCGTVGSLLLVAKDSSIDSLWKTISYHLGAGVGFTAAMLLLWSLHQRLGSCKAPKSFRGLPLEMITIGLIGLALAGITGTPLPA